MLFERGLICVAHSYGKTPKSGSGVRCRCIPRSGRFCVSGSDAVRRARWYFRSSSSEGRKSRMGTPDDMLGIESLLRAAGCHVPVRPWHALRHTFASHYVMSGGNLLALQKSSATASSR